MTRKQQRRARLYSTHPPTTSHNYLPLVERALAITPMPPGTVGEAVVAHDPWCDVHKSGRLAQLFCNCKPHIRIIQRTAP